MKQEDKELLLKDLSARLPYKCVYSASRGITHWNKLILNIDTITKLINNEYDEINPYLRPMSSMTEEERKEYEGFIIHREHVNAWGQEWDIDCFSFDTTPRLIDWLNAHHFDYRGLIPKGLAIAVTEENNPYKS